MNAAQPTFFEMFLRDTAGDIELRRMTWQAQNGSDGRYAQPVSIASRNLNDLLKFSANGGGDIFLGINTRKPGVTNAQKEEVCEITCIATDVDFKSVSKPAFERALLSFSHKPTAIINSGNGRHLYWILSQPIVVQGPKDIELAEGISKGIAKHLGGDSTHDVTRILRVPGRPNSKYIHKPMCEIIAADGPRYSIDDLKRYWLRPESINSKAKLGAVPDELPEKLQMLLAKNRRVKDTWNGERPDLADQSGSGYDMAMASILVRQGFSDIELAAVLRHMPAGKGREATDAYLSHTIGKARQGKEIDIFAGEPGAEQLHLTELGNAQRLVRLHGDDIRFCSERGWYFWDGRRWKHDATGEIKRRAKDTVRSIYLEAANCADGKLRDALGEHARRSEAKGRLDALVSLAESEPGVPITHAELDKDPWLLNVDNGTIDLRTGQLKPHNRCDLITKIVPINFDPDAECPAWLKFLDRIFASRADLVRFLRKAIGYSLTGLTTEQCAFILYGLGLNGKSTLLKIFSHLLGEYWRQMRTETLMLKRGFDGIPNDIAALFGARLATAVETENGRRLAESMLKQLTGGDTMTARFLHREFFDFEPQFKIWLACNHKPRITGTDLAIWRRIRLIPFTVAIPETERDPNLLDKLRAELPGILAWAVAGCELWQTHGLKPPEEVTAATNEYRQESDSIAQFIDECCTTAADQTVSKTGLYEAYQKWAEQSGEHPVTKKALGTSLLEKGFKEARTGKARFWDGIGLRNDG